MLISPGHSNDKLYIVRGKVAGEPVQMSFYAPSVVILVEQLKALHPSLEVESIVIAVRK